MLCQFVLCCVMLCYVVCVYTYMNIQILIFTYEIFASPKSFLFGKDISIYIYILALRLLFLYILITTNITARDAMQQLGNPNKVHYLGTFPED